MVKPFIIGTRNSRDMLHAGAEVLGEGGSAMDAVEAAVRLVESNPEDNSVGMGGIPNLLGVQELDASIMDGRTLRTGAVGAVKGFLHPISIARKVMGVSPHVLLVGEGAELFAERMGMEKGSLETERSRQIYKAFVDEAMRGLPDTSERPWWLRYMEEFNLREWYDKLSGSHGTVNVMAMDAGGDMCVGVSTSGTSFKFPGRLGDSPIIGAGNYCDNRFGAAACTGRGELAIRLSTARTIISYLENGMTLREACFRAMKDINELKEKGGMNCLAFDREGNTMSASTRAESTHYYMDADSDEPELREGIWVKE